MDARARTIVICLLLGACSAKNTALYLMDPPALTVHLPDRLGRVEVRDVVLPQYASAPEITVQGPDGALRPHADQLWAETPGHAVTQVLADQISALSGATAVAEPWPLSSGPDRRLEVRIERMLAGADGQFRLKGQYFISPASGEGRDIARRFDLAVPLAGSGAAAIAQAQALALQQLAGRIAQLK